MDWDAFRDQIEDKIKEAEGLKLRKRIMKFNEVVIESAKVHVGKAKPGKRKSSVKRKSLSPASPLKTRDAK